MMSSWVKEIIIYNPFVVKYKSAIIIFIKIIIAAGLLIYIVDRVNPDEIIIALRGANLLFILAALLLLILNIYLQYWKWEVVCKNVLGVSDKSKILKSLFYGLSAGSFTPARIGEYFGRAMMFRDKSISEITVATFIDKIIPLLLIAFVGALGSIVFIHFYYHVTIFISASLFIFVFIISYIFLYLVLNPSIWKSSVIKKIKLSKRLSSLAERKEIFKKINKRVTYQVAFISFLFFLCMLFQYVLLVSAFSHHIDILNYMWAGILMFFSKSIIPPVTIGDLGIREGASAFFISIIGESSSTGFNAAIFLFFINILIPAVIGMFLLFQKNDD